MKKKAVFIDRDGVINEIIYHKEMGIIDSPFTVEQFNLLPNVAKAINKFHGLGFKIIIVSNQPGIALNHFDMNVFEKTREKMRIELRKNGAEIDADYYCLHHPNAKIKKYKGYCECKKPEPGMLLNAANKQDIDLSKSWMIGDGLNDIQAGRKAGCKTIFIGKMKCDICKIMEEKKAKPDYIASDLYNASLIIEKEERK